MPARQRRHLVESAVAVWRALRRFSHNDVDADVPRLRPSVPCWIGDRVRDSGAIWVEKRLKRCSIVQDLAEGRVGRIASEVQPWPKMSQSCAHFKGVADAGEKKEVEKKHGARA